MPPIITDGEQGLLHEGKSILLLEIAHRDRGSCACPSYNKERGGDSPMRPWCKSKRLLGCPDQLAAALIRTFSGAWGGPPTRLSRTRAMALPGDMT